MNPWVRSQPSQTHEVCDEVARVRASVDCDEYDSFRSGVRPPGAGGTRSGIAYVKSPACEPADHEPAGDSWLAVQVPCGDDESAATAYTEPAPAATVADTWKLTASLCEDATGVAA